MKTKRVQKLFYLINPEIIRSIVDYKAIKLQDLVLYSSYERSLYY